MLVLLGVRLDGTKELIALAEGLRESTESWADLLRDCRRRGMHDPEPVVCDGLVGPWFIDLFRTAAREQAVPLSYVVLRPDRHTTLERATGRTGEALTGPEPIRSSHDQFSNLGIYETHVLDSAT